MSGTLTWEEFLKQANEFVELSKKFGDNWELIEKGRSPGQTYLCCKKRISTELESQDNLLDIFVEELDTDDVASVQNNKELLYFEYHVIYSISYQVPVLYFKGHKNDGTLINLDDSWKLFSNSILTTNDNLKSKMLSILTQMDHPILFRPYLALHPCKTSELLQIANKSKNYIVTFLSLMGPFVKLNLKSEYGIHFND